MTFMNRPRSLRRLQVLCAGALGAALVVSGAAATIAPHAAAGNIGGALGVSLMLSGTCLLIAVSNVPPRATVTALRKGTSPAAPTTT